jgi:hypothetical protein
MAIYWRRNHSMRSKKKAVMATFHEATKDIAARVAQSLMEDGWIQGQLSLNGAHCAFGAIREQDGGRDYGYHSIQFEHALDMESITAWNDNKKRTIHEVVGFFQDFAEGRFDYKFDIVHTTVHTTVNTTEET